MKSATGLLAVVCMMICEIYGETREDIVPCIDNYWVSCGVCIEYKRYFNSSSDTTAYTGLYYSMKCSKCFGRYKTTGEPASIKDVESGRLQIDKAGCEEKNYVATIVGSVVGGVLFLVLVIAALVCCIKCFSREKNPSARPHRANGGLNNGRNLQYRENVPPQGIIILPNNFQNPNLPTRYVPPMVTIDLKKEEKEMEPMEVKREVEIKEPQAQKNE